MVSKMQPCPFRAYVVEVESPDDFGSVIGDLSSRRGQVEGQSVDDGLSKVQAKVPLAEMFGYATNSDQ